MIYVFALISVFNTLLLVLALAAIGRLIRDRHEVIEALLTLIRCHQQLIEQAGNLHEIVENSLDCLLTIDARASELQIPVEQSPVEQYEQSDPTSLSATAKRLVDEHGSNLTYEHLQQALIE